MWLDSSIGLIKVKHIFFVFSKSYFFFYALIVFLMLAVIKTLAFLCACFLIFYFSTTTFFLCCQFCAETLCIDFIENVKGLEFKCINLSVEILISGIQPEKKFICCGRHNSCSKHNRQYHYCLVDEKTVQVK